MSHSHSRAADLNRATEQLSHVTGQYLRVKKREEMKRDLQKLRFHLARRVREEVLGSKLKAGEIARRSQLSKTAFRKLVRGGFLTCPISTFQRVTAALGKKLHIDII